MLGGTGGPPAVPSWVSQSVGETDPSPGRQPRGVRAELGEIQAEGSGLLWRSPGDCWNPKGCLNQLGGHKGLPGGGVTHVVRNEQPEEERKVCWVGGATVGSFGGESVVSVQGTER